MYRIFSSQILRHVNTDITWWGRSSEDKHTKTIIWNWTE